MKFKKGDIAIYYFKYYNTISSAIVKINTIRNYYTFNVIYNIRDDVFNNWDKLEISNVGFSPKYFYNFKNIPQKIKKLIFSEIFKNQKL